MMASLKAKIAKINHTRGYTLVELLLVMLLLTLFGITVVAIIQAGSLAYSKVAENRAAESDARIAIGYVDVRVRQNDVQGGVTLTDNPLGEGYALALRENFDGLTYVTWIFYLDGVLYECPLMNEGDLPILEFSQPIASLDDFAFERVSQTALRQTAIYPIRTGSTDTEIGEISALISLRAADLDFTVDADEE